MGVRVYPKFRVGFFGFFTIRVFRSGTRNYTEILQTRQFGCPKIRVQVRVFPIYPNREILEEHVMRSRGRVRSSRLQSARRSWKGVVRGKHCVERAASVAAASLAGCTGKMNSRSWAASSVAHRRRPPESETQGTARMRPARGGVRERLRATAGRLCLCVREI